MNVGVPFVGCENNEPRARVRGSNGANCVHSAHRREAKGHEGHSWFMLHEERDRFFPRASLGYDHHVGARVHDGSHTYTHQRMVIHDHDSNFLYITQGHAANPFPGIDTLRGTRNVNSVPAPVRLFNVSSPPRRLTRSLIPTSP